MVRLRGRERAGCDVAVGVGVVLHGGSVRDRRGEGVGALYPEGGFRVVILAGCGASLSFVVVVAVWWMVVRIDPRPPTSFLIRVPCR